MKKEKTEHVTRAQENTRTNRRKEDKMDRTLNYLIALVSVLVVITLAVIFMTGDEDEAGDQQAGDALQSENTQTARQDEQEDETEDGQAADDEPKNEVSAEDDSTVDASEDAAVVNASDDPLVAEVWTSESWQPYPTAQTGEHRSTFAQGDVDYEEKLQSIFSVVPIEQQDSIIWSVKNNGNAKSAIAVVSSNDKTQKYRVAIEWIEQQGWKPIQVEVLNTLEGTY